MTIETRDIEFAKFVDQLTDALEVPEVSFHREKPKSKRRRSRLAAWFGIGPWSTLARLV